MSPFEETVKWVCLKSLSKLNGKYNEREQAILKRNQIKILEMKKHSHRDLKLNRYINIKFKNIVEERNQAVEMGSVM